MNPQFQRRVQRYGWDKAADYYDNSWQRQLRPAQKRLLEIADLQPGERVLDVACGTGLVTLPAARSVVPGGSVLGIDLSDGMIDAARRRARAKSVENVSFQRMDAEALDLPDAKSGSVDTGFDAALCSLGLMYAPDPKKALEEIARVLRPGGRAVAVVWGARSNCGWAEVFPIVDRRVASDVCPLFFRLGTGNTLAHVFEEAGFVDVVSERFSVSLPFDDDKEACDAAFWGGAVALAWRKFDEETRTRAQKEYLASIEGFRNGEGYDIPGEFVVVKGERLV